MLIKICGNTENDNLEQVEALQPNLVGLIFYPKSRRYVGEQLKDYTFNTIPVGVFVDEPIENILSVSADYGIRHLQLHGQEAPETCEALRKDGFTIYKAFGLESETDLTLTELYEGTCDYFLFDTKTSQHGGSGRSFDWQMLGYYLGDTPFILSGGIGLANIADALAINHPKLVGIDLNSQLELRPGIKDIVQTKQIITTIRNHERN